MSDSPPVIKMVEEDINNELLEDHTGEKTGWCYVGEINCLMPLKYAEENENFYNFECRPDDVWIVTFPRSGTTLSQELIWILMNNFDYEKGEEMNLWMRSPFFEFHTFAHEETLKGFMEENVNDEAAQKLIMDMTASAVEKLNDMESPRLIKTHMPISLLPKGVKTNKIIYVARNPKDILPSYYYLLRLWNISGYAGSFFKFWKQFKSGHVPWGPFWAHVNEAWNLRDKDNILFLFYEEIVEDISKAIIKIAEFLEIEVTDEQVEGLADHMSIPNFSKNKSVNMESLRKVGILKKNEPGFIRTENRRPRPEEYYEIEEEILEWIQENYETTDLRFPPSN